MKHNLIWGKHLWFVMENFALNFPDDSSEQIKNDFKHFYTSIANVLPCEKCKNHYNNILNEYNIENYLENNEKLFEWVCIIHNKVNKDTKSINEYYVNHLKYIGV
jgi:hypothetical protein